MVTDIGFPDKVEIIAESFYVFVVVIVQLHEQMKTLDTEWSETKDKEI